MSTVDSIRNRTWKDKLQELQIGDVYFWRGIDYGENLCFVCHQPLKAPLHRGDTEWFTINRTPKGMEQEEGQKMDFLHNTQECVDKYINQQKESKLDTTKPPVNEAAEEKFASELKAVDTSANSADEPPIIRAPASERGERVVREDLASQEDPPKQPEQPVPTPEEPESEPESVDINMQTVEFDVSTNGYCVIGYTADIPDLKQVIVSISNNVAPDVNAASGQLYARQFSQICSQLRTAGFIIGRVSIEGVDVAVCLRESLAFRIICSEGLMAFGQKSARVDELLGNSPESNKVH